MGTRASKAERQKRETVKTDVFEKAKANLEEKKRRQDLANHGAVINHPFQGMLHQAKLHQLDRKGMALTKADLVATLIRLKNLDEKSPLIYQYQNLSCDDLRSFIRLILYSPETLEEENKGQGGGVARVQVMPPPPQQFPQLPAVPAYDLPAPPPYNPHPQQMYQVVEGEGEIEPGAVEKVPVVMAGNTGSPSAPPTISSTASTVPWLK